MSKNGKIELTKAQLLKFLGNQYLKAHVKVEYFKKQPEYEYVGNGASMYDHYFIINKHESKTNDFILFKSWKEEKNIPYTDALWDDSDKVTDTKFYDSQCKYSIEYSGRKNKLTLYIEIINEEDKYYPKKEYTISLEIADVKKGE